MDSLHLAIENDAHPGEASFGAADQAASRQIRRTQSETDEITGGGRRSACIGHHSSFCISALKMGTSGREFATASLKEYPQLLCQGLADVVEHWCRKYTCEPTVGSPDVMHDFLHYSTCLRQSLNEDAQRGPDFAF